MKNGKMLAETNPELIKEWHPIKNGDLKACDVVGGSEKKVWWYLPYDDPKTGKHFGFEWEASVYSRVIGAGCPFISGRAVWQGYNDLNTINPEVAKEWHPLKNGTLTPMDVIVGSSKKVWWYLPYDDPKTSKHFDFEWKASIVSRVKGVGCPFVSNKSIWIGYNDLATTHPELVKEWHPKKNGDIILRRILFHGKCSHAPWLRIWIMTKMVAFQDPQSNPIRNIS